MKKIAIYILIIISTLACEEVDQRPIGSDPNGPGVVTNVKVESLPGGARIEYDIPDDSDLLYVKAEYTLTNGRKMEVKSSLYENSLVVKGFNDEVDGNTYEVLLSSVDRSDNASDPVKVQISPKVSPINLVKNSMSITSSFGGASYSWENMEEEPITFFFLADTVVSEGGGEGELSDLRIINNSLEKGGYIARGFPAKPRKFGVKLQDNYGNITEVIKPSEGDKITPLFEKRLDKNIMHVFEHGETPVEDKWDYWEGKPWQIIDDNTSHTSVVISYQSPYPRHLTIDLGKEYKMSRYVWHQRMQSNGAWAYSYGNPKTWYVYVRKTKPDPAQEITEDLDGDGKPDWTNHWTLINSVEIEKPSGLPGSQVSSEDLEIAREGHNFDIPLETETFRYIRYGVTSNFDGSGWCNWGEIDFYGTENF